MDKLWCGTMYLYHHYCVVKCLVGMESRSSGPLISLLHKEMAIRLGWPFLLYADSFKKRVDMRVDAFIVEQCFEG